MGPLLCSRPTFGGTIKRDGRGGDPEDEAKDVEVVPLTYPAFVEVGEWLPHQCRSRK